MKKLTSREKDLILSHYISITKRLIKGESLKLNTHNEQIGLLDMQRNARIWLRNRKKKQ